MKDKMLTVRLSKETEKKLTEYCLDEGVSKSTVVKEALVAYFSQKRGAQSPYEAGADLFGQEGSQTSDGSVTYKQRLKDKLNAKHSH